MRKRRVLAASVGALLLIAAAGAGLTLLRKPPIQVVEIPGAVDDDATKPFTLDDYAAILRTYVNDQGLVNYRGLQAHRAPLDRFARALGRVDPKAYEDWTEPARIAFWLNAYNALTLEVIVNHYPLKADPLRAVVFPANSIRRIPGARDRMQFIVLGRKRTLDDIEHRVLRREFSEPRIHLARVSAAAGGPSLRREPYDGARLDAQLDDQARAFVADAGKFRIDRDKAQVHVSSIFKWFGGDFLRAYATDADFAGHSAVERAVLNFHLRYLVEKEDRDYLTLGRYTVEYLSYDWSLNEAPPAAATRPAGGR